MRGVDYSGLCFVGFSLFFAVCDRSYAQEGAPFILNSQPPSYYVDANQDQHQSTGALQGWTSSQVTFSEPVQNVSGGNLSPANFSLHFYRSSQEIFSDVDIATGLTPTIQSVTGSGAGPYTLTFSSRLPLQAYTEIVGVNIVDATQISLRVQAEGNRLVFGFMSTDIDGNGLSNGSDIVRYLQILTGAVAGGSSLLDLNRNGLGVLQDPGDVTRMIQLLNGALTYQPWGGKAMGMAPRQEGLVVDLLDEGYRIYGPTVEDVNGDQIKEIFLLRASGLVDGLTADGEMLPGFPVNLIQRSGIQGAIPGSYTTGGFVTVIDLENNGTKELIAVAKYKFANSSENNSLLFVLQSDGNPFPSWPSTGVAIGNQGSLIPVVADLDKDGTKEIIIKGHYTNPLRNLLYVFRPDGTQLNAAFPWMVSDFVTAGFVRSIPAVANMDADMYDEIIFNGGEVISLGVGGISQSKIHVMNHQNASEVAGWPVLVTGVMTTQRTVVVGDVDRNGQANVVVAEEISNTVPISGTTNSLISVFNSNGSQLSGWPVQPSLLGGSSHCSGGFSHSPSLADIDGNGSIEVLVACTNGQLLFYGYVHVLQATGEYYPGWPRSVMGFHPHESWQLVASDLDGDNMLEVGYAVEGQNDVDIMFWHYDGTNFPGMPISIPGPRAATKSSPLAISDLSNDGDVELIYTKSFRGDLNYTRILSMDFHAPFNPTTGWPAFGRDQGHTNYHP